MKRFLFLLTLAVFFISCHEEDQPTTNEAVQFTLSISRSDDGHTINDFPDIISVELTVESARGERIFKAIDFRKSGDLFISGPIDIQAGNYTLNDLVILTENITASPGLFDEVLIRRDSPAKILIGRASLVRRGARPLAIAVYTEQEGKAKLTSAKVTIYDNERETYVYDQSAKIHNIVFKGDPDESYTLKIEKEGYEVYANTFIYNQLQKKRLAITLQEKSAELAVTFEPSATLFDMWLEVMGKGTLVLDWGQGEPEALEFDVDPENATATAYFVREQAYGASTPGAKLTGDVHLLAAIVFESAVDAVNLQHATGLQGLGITDSDLPILDLQRNNQLVWLNVTSSNIVELILPQRHMIMELSIQTLNSWTTWPSVSDLYYIIANIHANAVAAKIYGGSIRLGGAPVSDETNVKLMELQDTYGWSIWY